MSQVTDTIDVDAPISRVYNLWTQFESFPAFMAGVQEVRQIDDTHVHWRAEVWGKEVEWDAEITEQQPDQRVAWRTTRGAHNDGVVTFQPLDDRRTRVMLQLDFDPEGLTEKAGDLLGIVRTRTKGDLKRFKTFIEERGTETGAWRGTVN